MTNLKGSKTDQEWAELQKQEQYLFLDDIRIPVDAFEYTNEPMFVHKKWDIVRTYEEFVEWITINGMPDFISFDHDLADSHYTPEYLWRNFKKSLEWQMRQVHIEPTGLDCADWLVLYCRKNGRKLPKYDCHSANPVGKALILGLLNFYKQDIG